MKKKLFILFVLLNTVFYAKAQDNENIKILDTETFKAAINEKDVQLVDVRTPREYNLGHIKNALNIDYLNPSLFKTSFEKLDKDKPLYIYCRSGNRSQKAARILVDMGFNKIYDLKGGYLIWN